MLTRRSFLQSQAVVALSSTVPLFITRSANGLTPEKDSRVLVVVELIGGNDALNTVVPFRDETYLKARPKLKLDPNRLVKLNDSLGLHPALKPLDPLLQAGRLAVCPGVGYPNPFRSHFEGMAAWHTANPGTGLWENAATRAGHGWLGRVLDPSAGSLFFVGGGSDMPQALRGRRSCAVSLDKLEDVLISDPTAVRAGLETRSDGELTDFIRRQAVNAQSSSEQLTQFVNTKGSARYPDTALAGRLKLVSQLLKGDVGARVFYTRQDGYDTHRAQETTHADLLRDLAGAVAAFFADLKESKQADRVTLLTFSEFGRTIKENVSGGTDHGTAGVVFVAGSSLKGGVLGTMPSLLDLADGEPVATTDFRTLYASVLENWLGLPSESALGGKFICAPLFE